MDVEKRPPIPLDRALEDDELAALLASVLLNPKMNPHLDWLSVGEFAAKAMWTETNSPSPDRGKFVAANGGSEALSDRVHELCWDWFRAGFLVPAGESRFRLSRRGRDSLTGVSEEGRVLDRTWFGDRLTTLVGPQGPIAIEYATEAHEAMLAGLYRSAAVMIGVASEALVFGLADELRLRRATFQLSTLSVQASALATLEWETTAFRERGTLIKGALKEADSPVRWVDELPGLLSEGNAIRLLRNGAGHPTGQTIGRRQALGLFVLFPAVGQAIAETTVAIGAIAADPSST